MQNAQNPQAPQLTNQTNQSQIARSEVYDFNHKKPTQQPYTTQPKAAEKTWIIRLLIVLAVTIVISIIYTMISPNSVPVQQNSWGFVTPGYKLSEQAIQQLGEPVAVKETEDGTENSYKSAYPSLPHTITVDQNSIVKFVKEYVNYDENHTLQTYTSKFGDPDLQFIGFGYTDTSTANVFLDEGFVVFTHPQGNIVESKWYFEPTTQETFLAGFGAEFLEPPHEPESFD